MVNPNSPDEKELLEQKKLADKLNKELLGQKELKEAPDRLIRDPKLDREYQSIHEADKSVKEAYDGLPTTSRPKKPK